MAQRTAPTVAIAGVNKTLTTIHLVDASGDNFTDVLETVTPPTDIQVEAWVAQYQLATQASVWKVSQSTEWVGTEDPDNADVGQRNSVKNGINLLSKNIATLKTQSPRVVAPVAAIMQGNQDIPLLTIAPFPDLITAMLAILAGYTLDSAQYTDRRERNNNPRIKV